VAEPPPQARKVRRAAPRIDPFAYAAAEKTRRVHVPTGFEGIDAMFGGGLPRPAAILLGGGQGSGKSTLCLQIAAHVGSQHVLYIAGEEPRGDVRLRGDTFGLSDQLQHLKIFCCNAHNARDLALLRPALAVEKRKLIIIDSLNCLVDSEHDTRDKQQNMLRNTQYLFDQSRASQCLIIAIVRLNKGEDVAGIREIEYVPDATVLLRRAEGSEPRSMRVLFFPKKNRFGDDAAETRFLMSGTGLHEISDAQVGEMEERAKRKRRGRVADDD